MREQAAMVMSTVKTGSEKRRQTANAAFLQRTPNSLSGGSKGDNHLLIAAQTGERRRNWVKSAHSVTAEKGRKRIVGFQPVHQKSRPPVRRNWLGVMGQSVASVSGDRGGPTPKDRSINQSSSNGILPHSSGDTPSPRSVSRFKRATPVASAGEERGHD
jgi:hypothetical protein